MGFGQKEQVFRMQKPEWWEKWLLDRYIGRTGWM